MVLGSLVVDSGVETQTAAGMEGVLHRHRVAVCFGRPLRRRCLTRTVHMPVHRRSLGASTPPM